MDWTHALEAAPLVITAMIAFNALMYGLYSTLQKFCEQALKYPMNRYLISGSVIACKVMRVLEMVGFSPVKPEVKQAIKQTKKDIAKIKTVEIPKLKAKIAKKKDRNNGSVSKSN
jgi:hypothetical protein